MTVFDVLRPIFEHLDSLIAIVLPSWLRLILWATLAGGLSMGLYRKVSDQEMILRGKKELMQARERLNAFDGLLRQALPLLRDMLLTALRQVLRVGLPAVVASLPIVFLLNWISSTYGYAYPEAGGPVRIDAVPQGFRAVWVQPGNAADKPYPSIVILDDGNRIVADLPVAAPVPVIHKKKWWNVLFGNPAGYLPDGIPVERIRASLPHQQHLLWGPKWMRGWEFIFFTSLIAVSAGLKKIFKIA